MCLITALLGLTGTMLNSRPILAFYTLLLWPTLAAILIVGYSSYKKQALSLDRKLNQAWSQFFNDAARLRIQNNVRILRERNPIQCLQIQILTMRLSIAALLWLVQSSSCVTRREEYRDQQLISTSYPLR